MFRACVCEVFADTRRLASAHPVAGSVILGTRPWCPAVQFYSELASSPSRYGLSPTNRPHLRHKLQMGEPGNPPFCPAEFRFGRSHHTLLGFSIFLEQLLELKRNLYLCLQFIIKDAAHAQLKEEMPGQVWGEEWNYCPPTPVTVSLHLDVVTSLGFFFFFLLLQQHRLFVYLFIYY